VSSVSKQKRVLQVKVEGKAKLHWLLQVESCFAHLIRTCSQSKAPKKKKKKTAPDAVDDSPALKVADLRLPSNLRLRPAESYQRYVQGTWGPGLVQYMGRLAAGQYSTSTADAPAPGCA
jgi:hypothetical protein